MAYAGIGPADHQPDHRRRHINRRPALARPVVNRGAGGAEYQRDMVSRQRASRAARTLNLSARSSPARKQAFAGNNIWLVLTPCSPTGKGRGNRRISSGWTRSSLVGLTADPSENLLPSSNADSTPRTMFKDRRHHRAGRQRPLRLNYGPLLTVEKDLGQAECRVEQRNMCHAK